MRVKVYSLWRLVYGSNSRNETSIVYGRTESSAVNNMRKILELEGAKRVNLVHIEIFLLESASAIWRLQRVAGRIGTLPTRPR